MDMMSTGVRTPVGIRIVAPDPSRLEALGAAVRSIALAVPGTRSVVMESLGGETRLEFAADPAALARHHVDPAAPLPTTYAIGDGLLTSYVLPFELASVVLLAALIGAVVLSRKELKDDDA